MTEEDERELEELRAEEFRIKSAVACLSVERIAQFYGMVAVVRRIASNALGLEAIGLALAEVHVTKIKECYDLPPDRPFTIPMGEQP